VSTTIWNPSDIQCIRHWTLNIAWELSNNFCLVSNMTFKEICIKMPQENMIYFISDTCSSSKLMHSQPRFSKVQFTTSSAFPFPSGISSLNSVSFSSFHCCLSSCWNVNVRLQYCFQIVNCLCFKVHKLNVLVFWLWSLLVNGYVLYIAELFIILSRPMQGRFSIRIEN